MGIKRLLSLQQYMYNSAPFQHAGQRSHQLWKNGDKLGFKLALVKISPKLGRKHFLFDCKKSAKAARSFPTCHMIFKTEARAGEKPVQSGVWPLSFRLKMHVAML